MLDRHRSGGLTALVIDEAQSLPHDLLEEVRLLANFETETDKLLPVVLAGQPELAARLEHEELRQLKQRVALRCDLTALDVRETMAPPAYEIPVTMEGKAYHQPHLENFFDAIRGKAKLNCPAEIGYETAVMVLKVNEAVEAARRLEFKPDEFKV